MAVQTISKTLLLMVALAVLAGCASYGQHQATAGLTSPAQSSGAALDRFFAEEDLAARIGR